MFDMAQQVELTGYRPGGLGKVVELHGRYYGAEWNFDLAFEADIATDLSGFLQRLDPARDGFWLAWLDDAMVGSITIDGHGVLPGARLFKRLAHNLRRIGRCAKTLRPEWLR